MTSLSQRIRWGSNKGTGNSDCIEIQFRRKLPSGFEFRFERIISAINQDLSHSATRLDQQDTLFTELTFKVDALKNKVDGLNCLGNGTTALPGADMTKTVESIREKIKDLDLKTKLSSTGTYIHLHAFA